jgi:hypothetical protein
VLRENLRCLTDSKWKHPGVIIIRQLYIGSFQTRSILPPRRKFLPSRGGGEKKLFLIIVNVLGHPKGVGGLTSYFLRGGGMDVFWNDPLQESD